MGGNVTISLDAMGGDHGPRVVIPGADLALSRHLDLDFLLYGDEGQITHELKAYPELAARSQVIHTDVAIAMDAKPSQALRRGRRVSSMWQSLEAVKKGDAAVAVSAGNTGALMVMSRFCLKMQTGIERPAIAALWPTVNSECIVLDVGANIGADARQLVDFTLMGSALARALFGLETPTVGLLNIGVEEVKGMDEIKTAHAALKDHALPIEYIGFVEGDDIGHDRANVIVTEGFSGNIALKTAEGTARQLAAYLRQAMGSSIMSKAGAVLASGAFKILKSKMDPRNLNGGIFLGFNGSVIKSHGGMDPKGFANAIDLGYDLAKAGVLKRISADIEQFHHALEPEKHKKLNGAAASGDKPGDAEASPDM